MSRRPIAAVVGSGEADSQILTDARELGEALVTAGFRVLTGGRGGVMAAASQGAHRSPAWREGDVLGILPGTDPTAANPFVDIVLCTGMGHARNAIIVASADVVLAVGGKAGTLSELALAWVHDKPILAVGPTGWAGELAGRALDERQQRVIEGPFTVAAAVARARELTDG